MEANAALSLPTGRRRRSTIARWLDAPANAEARGFVDAWIEMDAAGTTEWSGLAVLNHLQESHGFPFTSEPSFYRWIAAQRRERGLK